MRIEDDELYYRYVLDILNALHIKMFDFFHNYVNNLPYENLIFLWITKLYEKGKPSSDAIQIIFKARIMYIVGKK